MTALLPPSLLAKFVARPMPAYSEPTKKPSKPYKISGLASFLSEFTPEIERDTRGEEEEREKKREEQIKLKNEEEFSKKEKQEELLKKMIEKYDPRKDPKIDGNTNHTLFIARLSHSTSEHKLKREFEEYGHIKKVRIVCDKNGKPRGYAFIEFEKEKERDSAKKYADGRKIDGRRILCDRERGRLSRSWLPKRLGGGLNAAREETREPRRVRSRSPPRSSSSRSDDRSSSSRKDDYRESSSSSSSSRRDDRESSSSSSSSSRRDDDRRSDKDDRRSDEKKRERDEDRRSEKDDRRSDDRDKKRERERDDDRSSKKTKY